MASFEDGAYFIVEKDRKLFSVLSQSVSCLGVMELHNMKCILFLSLSCAREKHSNRVEEMSDSSLSFIPTKLKKKFI